MKTIRIGGAQGFWGDLNEAPVNMAKNDQVDYIACDYLAELTLSIMQRQKEHNPQRGYARDFITALKDMLPMIKEKSIKVLTNAGGMNVKCAVEAVKQAIKESGLNLKVGYVLGDDVMSIIPQLRKQGITMNNMDTNEPIDAILNHMVNANVYYGAEPIIECLQGGADIVIVGRSTDSSLFLAPLAYEFGWKKDDWDGLATGILSGHLLECGAQVSGGNYDYDWRNVPHPENLGYPIAEVSGTGSLIMTKTKNMGGLMTTQSVKEQLLYEIHDPKKYLTPDVIADFSNVTVKQIGQDRVLVEGVKGHKRPDTLKLCVGYSEGYRNVGYLPFSWPDALDKAQRAAEILKLRLKNKGLDAMEIREEFLGLNTLHGPLAEEMKEDLNEVILRFAIKTKNLEEANKLTPEIAPFILNGPPASCFFGGRTKPSEVFALWPTLIPRDAVKFEVHVEEVK
ncbi:ABC transporter substrate-binding protein [Clostridium folliculivorans]|uniref:ABC transporter substrate-binding protein n=1 Tax=Clostridium folliculivorans TaxID=2886038 RepID=A0A9W6D9P3_9CLOT|nr:acyclic terpene utilization AtuA family protein [Clostridium folliculivorans]GKU24359.1 ABC transporter substrate-binding protein [Clostridium folliculivorans]